MRRLGISLGGIAAVACALVASTAFVHSASGDSNPGTITFVVPVSSVRAQDPSKTAGPDYFRETWTPKRAAPVVRQDSVGFVEFDRGTFLGTVTLARGQIVYGGTTQDQDDFQYAILGGSGSYADARGTLTLHTIDRGHVRVTIALAG